MFYITKKNLFKTLNGLGKGSRPKKNLNGRAIKKGGGGGGLTIKKKIFFVGDFFAIKKITFLRLPYRIFIFQP